MLAPFETDHLALRPLRVEDARDYHALETDPEVKRFLGGPSKLTIEQYASKIGAGAAALATTLAVTSKETGKFVGRCGFTEYTELCETIGWEINIVLCRGIWNHGYGTEVGWALIPLGFAVLGCNKLLGVADAANDASLALCGRLRMTFEKETIRYGQAARIYYVVRNA
jgi:RimJ/RimL family protein N-acetyltransferase